MVPGVGDVTCKVKILSCIADLPAKAALLNCTQYNGQYGCHTCKHEGQQVIIYCSSQLIVLTLQKYRYSLLVGEGWQRVNEGV